MEKKNRITDELRNLDWQEIKNRLANFATCEKSRELLRGIGPCLSETEAQRSFSETSEILALLNGGVRPFVESLDLYHAWATRLSRSGILKTLELKDVRLFCLETLALTEVLRHHSSPYLKSLRARLVHAEEPLSAIDQLMTPDGEIRSDASETMHRLTSEKVQQARLVQQTLDRIVRDNQMETVLREKYVTTRDGRWVLPVKSGMRHSLQGIIHAASQTHQTVFMEPQETVPINNRLRQIDIEIEDEIEKLLFEISKYLETLVPEFESTRAAMLEFDVAAAKAQLALKIKGEAPSFRSDTMHFKGLRHPLLAWGGAEIVPNDVHVENKNRVLLLSGPNAGGKTVLLKSIGLAAQMARSGLFICADPGSTLPFFKRVFSVIGDAQSVDQHLSTFSSHLLGLQEALTLSSSENLLLVDEICGSTDPEEGSALARAFIEKYIQQNIFAVITSHLGGLKIGWPPDSCVVNGSLEFDKTAGPTYRFLYGVPGQSLAIQTARRVGVDTKVIERALDNLSPDAKKYQQSLEEVEIMRTQLSQLQRKLSEEMKRASHEKEKFLKTLESFQKDREQKLNQAVKRAEKKVDTILREIAIDDIFKKHEKHEKLEKVKTDLPVIVKPSSVTPEKQMRSFDSADQFAKAYPPGSKIYVRSLNQDGIVQSKPNSKGDVQVLSNSMRIQVSWRDLVAPETPTNPTNDLVRRAGHAGQAPTDKVYAIDIRGLSSEDAIDELEKHLDKAALRGDDRVKIIHGTGTEVLKRAIRAHLSRSHYVNGWRAGTPDSGGDGVTWAELR